MGKRCICCGDEFGCHQCMHIKKQSNDKSKLDSSFDDWDFAIFIGSTGIEVDTTFDVFIGNASDYNAKPYLDDGLGLNYYYNYGVLNYPGLGCVSYNMTRDINFTYGQKIGSGNEQAYKCQGTWITTNEGVAELVTKSLLFSNPPTTYLPWPDENKISRVPTCCLNNSIIQWNQNIKPFFFTDQFLLKVERKTDQQFPLLNKSTLVGIWDAQSSKSIHDTFCYYNNGTRWGIKYPTVSMSPPFYIGMWKVSKSKNKVCFICDSIFGSLFALNMSFASFGHFSWQLCPSTDVLSTDYYNSNIIEYKTFGAPQYSPDLRKDSHQLAICCCPEKKFKQIVFEFKDFGSIYQKDRQRLTSASNNRFCTNPPIQDALVDLSTENFWEDPSNPFYRLHNAQLSLSNINSTIVIPVLQTQNQHQYINEYYIYPQPPGINEYESIWNCTFIANAYLLAATFKTYTISGMMVNEPRPLGLMPFIYINNEMCYVRLGIPYLLTQSDDFVSSFMLSSYSLYLKWFNKQLSYEQIMGDNFDKLAPNYWSPDHTITLPGIFTLGKLLCQQNPITYSIPQGHEFLGRFDCNYYNNGNPYTVNYHSIQQLPNATITITGIE